MANVLLGPDQAPVSTVEEWIENYGEPSAEIMNLIKIALLLKNTPDPE